MANRTAMKASGNGRTGVNAATVRALRSALIATGGQAKVAELYRQLTAAAAADFLGVSLSYVQHATGRGELPCVRIGKGDPRYRTIDLIAWQEARQAAAALIEWSGESKLRLFGEVEFNSDQRLERRMLAWIERGGGTLKELYRDPGNLGNSDGVHRKLKVFAALGHCFLPRSLDDRAREPLRIYTPAADGKIG